MEKRAKKETATCPRCLGVDKLDSTSRRDNKTMICSGCGTEEAMIDYALAKGYTVKQMSLSIQACENRMRSLVAQ